MTDYVATIWSWWRMQPIPSCHHRIEKHNLLRKYLHVQAEQLCVPRDHLLALQKKTHHVYDPQVLDRGNPAKLEVRRDTLVMMFTFPDQVHMSRQYGSVEELNQKARGLGSSIGFWNRLRSICPGTVFYNGPILNHTGQMCTTSQDSDQAMLDTRRFCFDVPNDQADQWAPALRSYDSISLWPEVAIPTTEDFLKTILWTKDSAPGPDGIPYSAWRP